MDPSLTAMGWKRCTTNPSRLPSAVSVPKNENPPCSPVPAPSLNPGAEAGLVNVTESWTALSRFALMVYFSSPSGVPVCLISYTPWISLLSLHQGRHNVMGASRERYT